jgi:hypothetical protein
VSVSYFFENGKISIVAEKPDRYFPTEESKLIKYFRKIKEKNSKDIILQVARLAARGKT